MLRVIYDDGNPTSPAAMAPPAAVELAEGFHYEEYEEAEAFRWMERSGRLVFEPEDRERFLEMRVMSPYYDLSQKLEVELGEGAQGAREVELVQGWSQVSLRVPAGAAQARLEATKLLPPEHHPGDGRELAVRLAAVRLHADEARHASVHQQHANAVLNLRETLEGQGELRSTPPNLGIDLHGVCNVKPPCVYCDWDFSKELEGDEVDAPFTRETLDEWGDLFENATTLVNCSIGEPFMMKDLDRVLDAFGERGKSLEMATNGQILTERNIQKLLGRRIHLYVSLDAATAETYAKLRNDKFDRILVNLRRLIEAKGGLSGFPKVNLIFMPMRVNVHELEPFVELAAELGVDRVVLRPLNYNEATTLDWQRAGHHFRYADELLPWDELVRVSGRAAELCRRHGLELSDQMDFGGQSMEAGFREEYEAGRVEARNSAAAAGVEVAEAPPATPPAGAPLVVEPEVVVSPADRAGAEVAPQPETPSEAARPADPLPSLGAEKLPVCLEPWKSLYVLRRGILPCCHGSAPLAPADAYRETWNSPTLQAIRRDLAAGEFHEYCRCSQACPIVRKHQQSAPETSEDRTFQRLRHLWHRIDRLGAGYPKRLARPFRNHLLAAARWTSERLGSSGAG